MQDISTTLSNLAVSLVTLRNNTTYSEFDEILESIKTANDLSKLEELLDQALFIYNEGTDPASAFAHARFDVVHDPDLT